MATRQLTESDAASLLAIVRSIAPVTTQAYHKLSAITTTLALPSGKVFIVAGRSDSNEYVVLRGLVRAFSQAPDSRDLTLSFFPQGSVLTPRLARTKNGLSLFSCEALETGLVAAFDAAAFRQLMGEEEEIRTFANRVLEAELIRKTQKEISLATLPARERLLEMRSLFPGLENRVAHGHIASYLGITAISLSRLRGELTRKNR
jgi:CRP-like cAMP-binding protein